MKTLKWYKWLYWGAWCFIMLLAAFPRMILDGNVDFLKDNIDNKEYVIAFIIPLVMIIVGYLFDLAYTLVSIRPSYNKLKTGFIWSVIVLAFSLMGITFTMYFDDFRVKILCFSLTFLLVSAMKLVSLFVTEDDVVEVLKV